MTKNSLVVVTVDEYVELTLEEICVACNASSEFIEEIIQYGIIEPRRMGLETLRFDLEHLRRIKMVQHLQKDLEVNIAGAALVIEMMDKMERMRKKLELLERHVFSSLR